MLLAILFCLLTLHAANAQIATINEDKVLEKNEHLNAYKIPACNFVITHETNPTKLRAIKSHYGCKVAINFGPKSFTEQQKKSFSDTTFFKVDIQTELLSSQHGCLFKDDIGQDAEFPILLCHTNNAQAISLICALWLVIKTDLKIATIVEKLAPFSPLTDAQKIFVTAFHTAFTLSLEQGDVEYSKISKRASVVRNTLQQHATELLEYTVKLDIKPTKKPKRKKHNKQLSPPRQGGPSWDQFNTLALI